MERGFFSRYAPGCGKATPPGYYSVDINIRSLTEAPLPLLNVCYVQISRTRRMDNVTRYKVNP